MVHYTEYENSIENKEKKFLEQQKKLGTMEEQKAYEIFTILSQMNCLNDLLDILLNSNFPWNTGYKFNLQSWNIDNLKIIAEKFNDQFKNINLNTLEALDGIISEGKNEILKIIVNNIDDINIEGLSQLTGICILGNIECLKLIFQKFGKIKVNELVQLERLLYGNSNNLKIIFEKIDDINIDQLGKNSVIIPYFNTKILKLIFDKFSDINLYVLKDLKRILCYRTKTDVESLLNMDLTLYDLIYYRNIKFSNLKKILEWVEQKHLYKETLIKDTKIDGFNISLHSDKYPRTSYENSLNCILSRGIPDVITKNLEILKNKGFCDNLFDIIEKYPLIISRGNVDDLEKVQNISELNIIQKKLIQDFKSNVKKYDPSLNFRNDEDIDAICNKAIESLTKGIPDVITKNLEILKNKGFGDNFYNIIQKYPIIISESNIEELKKVQNIYDLNKIYDDLTHQWHINPYEWGASLVEDLIRGGSIYKEDLIEHHFWNLCCKNYLHTTIDDKKFSREYLLQSTNFLKNCMKEDVDIMKFSKYYDGIAIQIIINCLILENELIDFNNTNNIRNTLFDRFGRINNRQQRIRFSANALRHSDYSIEKISEGKYKIICYLKASNQNGSTQNEFEVDINEFADKSNLDINLINRNIKDYLGTEDFENENVETNLEMQKLGLYFFSRLKNDKKNIVVKNNADLKYLFELFLNYNNLKSLNNNISTKIISLLKINYASTIYSICREIYIKIYGTISMVPELFELRNSIEHGRYIIEGHNVSFYGKNNLNSMKDYYIPALMSDCDSEFNRLCYL